MIKLATNMRKRKKNDKVEKSQKKEEIKMDRNKEMINFPTR
jgi:hypothetical protein